MWQNRRRERPSVELRQVLRLACVGGEYLVSHLIQPADLILVRQSESKSFVHHLTLAIGEHLELLWLIAVMWQENIALHIPKFASGIIVEIAKDAGGIQTQLSPGKRLRANFADVVSQIKWHKRAVNYTFETYGAPIQSLSNPKNLEMLRRLAED